MKILCVWDICSSEREPSVSGSDGPAIVQSPTFSYSRALLKTKETIQVDRLEFRSLFFLWEFEGFMFIIKASLWEGHLLLLLNSQISNIKWMNLCDLLLLDTMVEPFMTA